jgi:hypothetical protein
LSTRSGGLSILSRLSTRSGELPVLSLPSPVLPVPSLSLTAVLGVETDLHPFLETYMQRWRNLRHNLVVHPVAGVLWFLGFDRAGDWLHDNY